MATAADAVFILAGDWLPHRALILIGQLWEKVINLHPALEPLQSLTVPVSSAPLRLNNDQHTPTFGWPHVIKTQFTHAHFFLLIHTRVYISHTILVRTFH